MRIGPAPSIAGSAKIFSPPELIETPAGAFCDKRPPQIDEFSGRRRRRLLQLASSAPRERKGLLKRFRRDDKHQRKAQEARLRSSEEQYRAIFDASMDARSRLSASSCGWSLGEPGSVASPCLVPASAAAKAW